MKNFSSACITLFLSSLIVFSCQSYKQSISPSQSKITFEEKVDDIVISKMNAYNIPGLAIGLISGDEIVYSKGYGVKDINNSDPVTENSIFHTASISKLFTAQAIMMLVDANKIALDDKLVEIGPTLKYKDERIERITIENLLNHTSGLEDVSNYHWKNNNQSDDSLEEYVLDTRLKLKYEPLTQYYYSNLAYNILGYVIEKVTANTFDIYLKENIFNPNGMVNSDFRYFLIADSLKTAPQSKRPITKQIYKRKTYPYTREQAPSSTLNSSAIELSKWMISFLESIENNSLDNMFSQMTKPSFEPYPYIGLGFQLSTLESKSTIGHYGGDKGFRSYLLMIPEAQIGLVLLANCDYDEDFRQEILHPIAKLMLEGL